MKNLKKNVEDSKSDIKKENQDLPNIPASSQKINKKQPVANQIKQGSKLQKEGKTDNTEKK